MTYSDRATAIRAEVASLAYDADQALDAANALHNSDANTITDLRAKVAADVLLIETLRQNIADLTTKLAAATTPTPPPITTSPRPLRYRPPTLTNPIVWDFATQGRKADIPADRDAILKCSKPLTNITGGIEINGGRNVQWIGGEINYSGVDVSRALWIKGKPGGLTRNIHIEGVKFSGTSINGDAIDIDNQGTPATLTLQNIDISLTLNGAFGANHSDALQSWNGPNLTRIDGMVIRNAKYQGMFLHPKQWAPAGFTPWEPGLEFYNVHVIQDPAEFAYAFYNASAGRGVGANVQVRSGDAAGSRVGYPAGAWPFVTAYTGTPLPDDRFLSGKPGMGYVSPGYA